MGLQFPNLQAFVLLFVSFGVSVVAENACFDGTSRFVKDDWDFCQQLRPDLFMYYRPFQEKGNLMLGLHVTEDAFGWTSLALAGNGGMKGASQIVVRQDEGGTWIAEDRHSVDYVIPDLDESQDVKLLFADQTADGETSWAVLVPMNSCDPDDYPIQNVSMFMHWAIGDSHTFGYHGTRRGQFHANLMNTPMEFPGTEGLPFVDFLMPNVPVVIGNEERDPTNPYICSFFDLDQLTTEFTNGTIEPGTVVHVTRLSAALDEDSEGYVHHMLLYACDLNEDQESAYEHLQIVPDCESMPQGCNALKYAWAMGSEDMVLPENVGLPFGEKGRHWFALQTHYYNPTLDEGVSDSSGVRVYFTTDLRPEEAGMMDLNAGTGPWQRDSIPAGERDFTFQQPLVVPSTCTSSHWRSPLNVLGVAHHMHLSGTNVEINVTRDGRNLGPLRNEKRYDFKHQSLEATPLGQLLPGDGIVMNCHYDTTGVTEDVSFGEMTQNEMCYAILLYYPLQDRESFGYVPQTKNASDCYTAGTGLFANVSACAQSHFENVPRFLDFDDVEVPFDALTMCNSEWYETDVLPYAPYTCPECYMTKDCTLEEVVLHSQNIVCAQSCNNIGVSVYPNTSLTVPYDQGVYGCNAEGSTDWVTFVNALVPQESTTCTALGNLSQVVELAEAPTQEDVVNAGEVVSNGDSSEAEPKSEAQSNVGSLFLGLFVVAFSLVY